MCVPHAQRATAFHFLISKRLVGLREEEGPAAEEPSAAAAGAAGGGASVSMADISSRGGDRLCLSRSGFLIWGWRFLTEPRAVDLCTAPDVSTSIQLGFPEEKGKKIGLDFVLDSNTNTRICFYSCFCG